MQEIHAIPGARFLDPVVLAPHREPGARVTRRGGRVHQRAAQGPVLRRVGRLRRTPRLRARRRRAPDGLARVGPHRPAVHQGVRGRVQHELLGAAGRVEVDGLRQPRHHQARLRAHPRRVPDQPGAPPARPRGLCGVRQRRRGVRAAVGQAHGHGGPRDGPAEGRQPGEPQGPPPQAGRALRTPGDPGAHLGLLRGPRHRARSRVAAAVSRQRHHRVPRPRSAPSSSSASPTRRRSRIWRQGSRCRSCPRRSARNTGRW